MATPVSEAGRELPMAKVAPAFRTVPGDVREPADFIGKCAGQGERRQEDEVGARSYRSARSRSSIGAVPMQSHLSQQKEQQDANGAHTSGTPAMPHDPH